MLQKDNKYQQIFSLLNKSHPNAKIELDYKNTFELLIATLLAAQATDISVNKVTPTLFKEAPTPEKMLNLGIEKLKYIIKSIGLYNNKAKNIMLLCNKLIEKYEGEVPSEREELESLPGVGRKTANVILNAIFGKPTIAVDTHVFRVANRTKIALGKTPLEVEKKLLKITPKKFLMRAHYFLVFHGRYICKARNPLCEKCLIKDFCKYENK